MKYNKDYTSKTADEWFSLGKWTGFLCTLPVGKTIWEVSDYRDFLSIRSTAAGLSTDDDYDRTYKIEIAINNPLKFTITTAKK